MKYKFLLIVAVLFIYASSCEEDEPVEPFDHAAQALKDNDSLVKYMENHYVDAEGIIQMITNSEQQPIYNLENPDVNLKDTIISLTSGEEDINFTLYYYITEPGVNDSPTKVDWANVAYKGFQFESYINSDDELVYEEEVFDQNDWGIWADLYGTVVNMSVIKGWSEGLIHFKSGNKIIEDDDSVTYTETGKGILFIPSGLAYSNTGSGDIPPNTPLVFYVELNEVFRIDHDEDTVLSMFEDIDEDGEYADDDTDEDDIRNIYDGDDDGDNILTKYENPADEYGNPIDAQNTDNDENPDYLDDDDDGDGILTIDENPDPNGDGNPSDALDTDGDGTPDYLDDDN